MLIELTHVRYLVVLGAVVVAVAVVIVTTATNVATVGVMMLIMPILLLLLLLADGEIIDHVQNVGAIEIGQQTGVVVGRGIGT